MSVEDTLSSTHPLSVTAYPIVTTDQQVTLGEGRLPWTGHQTIQTKAILAYQIRAPWGYSVPLHHHAAHTLSQ